MLKVTSKAISVLKATAKSKAGVSDDAGIRIRRDAVSREDGTITVGLEVCDRPEASDAELEEDGLHIFVEGALREPLEGRTLDVQNEEEGPRFIFS
jgi:Fe-S cluster assembly iron-binding protein IscA